ncbi:MAG: DUF3006 domain-containing protein [Candidatus Spyradocola sp.]|jgi:hypothetical protein
MIVLDRMEADEAVLVGEEGPFRVPRARLSPDAREGDVLVFADGFYRPDAAATRERRAQMRRRLERLVRKKPDASS